MVGLGVHLAVIGDAQDQGVFVIGQGLHLVNEGAKGVIGIIIGGFRILEIEHFGMVFGVIGWNVERQMVAHGQDHREVGLRGFADLLEGEVEEVLVADAPVVLESPSVEIVHAIDVLEISLT